MVARELLRNADFVLKVAEELGVVVKPGTSYYSFLPFFFFSFDTKLHSMFQPFSTTAPGRG